MNMTKKICGVVLALLVAVPFLYAQESEPSSLLYDYTGTEVTYQMPEVQGASAMLTIHLEAAPLGRLGSREMIRVQHRLVSKDGVHQHLFPATYVAGHNRYLYLKRADELRNPRIYPEVPLDAILMWNEVKDQKMNTTVQIPYEPWMSDATLSVEEELSGCTSCGIRVAQQPIHTLQLRLFIPDLSRVSYQRPLAVALKEYTEDFDSYVNFELDKYRLLPEYKNNPKELSRIKDFVQKTLKMSDLGATVGRIEVVGYASPEGSFEYNHRLSMNRARTLSDYVQKTYPELAKVAQFEVIGGGEDWEGLRESLAKSDAPFASDVMAIIDKYGTDLNREADIVALEGGAVYKRLLADFFPPLRRTLFRTSYKVRSYETVELSKIFAEKPALLSHSELVALAIEQMEQSGKSPIPALRYAYENFGKKEPMARFNLALGLLKWEPEKASEALQLLEPLPESDDVTYLRATALYLMGQRDKAEQLMAK